MRHAGAFGALYYVGSQTVQAMREIDQGVDPFVAWAGVMGRTASIAVAGWMGMTGTQRTLPPHPPQIRAAFGALDGATAAVAFELRGGGDDAAAAAAAQAAALAALGCSGT